MGLFDKKYCDICGEKIGLLGNRKLADGNLCKNCAEKLSPWFSERKSSSVEDINAQLEYREANREVAAAFNPTLSFGECKKLLIDEDKMQFTVTSASNPASVNADIIDCSAITGVNLDVQESKCAYTERSTDGRNVEFESPAYRYDYDFYMVINVNHPYIDTIRFKLNNNSIEIDPEVSLTAGTMRGGMQQPARPMGAGAQGGARPGMQQPARPMGAGAQNGARPGMQQPARPMGAGAQNGARPGMQQSARPASAGAQNGARPGMQQPARPMGAGAQNGARPGMQQPARPMGAGAQNGARPGMQQPARPAGAGAQGGARPGMQQPRPQEETVYAVANKVDPSTNYDYQRFQEMGNQIISTLTDYRGKDREEEAVTPVAVICPNCGATTIPDAYGCCEYCGGAVNG